MVNNDYQLMAPKRHGAIMALINEVRTGSTAYQLTWAYDEVGNRLTQTKNGVLTTYTCNDANQLVTEITGSTAITYQYDPNGNLTAKTDPTGTTTWLYDYENRQINYQDPLNSGSYVYDASGRRIGHTSIVTALNSGGSQNAVSKIGVGNGKGKGAQNGQGTQNAIQNQYETITTTEKFVYDGANIIADYSLVSGIWNLASTYLTPFLDQNLLVSRDGSTYYFQADGLGSVRNLLDATQSVRNSYDYTAFGETLTQTENMQNRYKFTSREWDSESSTYHYRSRSYNSSNGRFMRRDSIGYLGGLNLYSYVRNNPVRYVDPIGTTQVMGPATCNEGDDCCKTSRSKWKESQYIDRDDCVNKRMKEELKEALQDAADELIAQIINELFEGVTDSLKGALEAGAGESVEDDSDIFEMYNNYQSAKIYGRALAWIASPEALKQYAEKDCDSTVCLEWGGSPVKKGYSITLPVDIKPVLTHCGLHMQVVYVSYYYWTWWECPAPTQKK